MKKITLSYLQNNFNLDLIEEYPNTVQNSLTDPIVSVILITFNHKDFIKDSIEGVLSQIVDFNYEIIIGDDGSIDGTREICIEYAQRHPDKIRLFLHSQENVVKVYGKKCGIFQIVYNHLQSRGKYVAICSGDDVWTDKNKLKLQADFLNKNKDFGIVASPYILSSNIGNDKIQNFTFKASTTMYININANMPLRFLNVIQEDDFTRFIVQLTHKYTLITKIKPVIINEPQDSIIRSMNNFDLGLHILNYSKQIFLTYFFSRYTKNSILLLFHLVRHILNNKKYKNIRIKIFYHFLLNNYQELKKD